MRRACLQTSPSMDADEHAPEGAGMRPGSPGDPSCTSARCWVACRRAAITGFHGMITTCQDDHTPIRAACREIAPADLHTEERLGDERHRVGAPPTHEP